MRWFSGSIPDAIQETKLNRKLLLVFVLDSTEDSVKMSAVLDESGVAEVLTPENVVALKLESGSESFAQFSVFYPVLILPSIYFIGDNGTPLEVVGGHQTVEPFLERTRTALKMHEGSSVAPVDATPDNSIPDAIDSSSNADTASSAVGAGSSDSAQQDAPSTSAATSSPAAHVEERVLTAKDKVDAQNRERIDKEKEREIERRKLGQVQASLVD